jgi:hypothetical protein
VSPLAVMEGCCWGMGTCVLFLIVAPTSWPGATAAFVLLGAVWAFAAWKEDES